MFILSAHCLWLLWEVYVGVGFDPDKEGTVGVSHGDSVSENAGLIDMVDLNGDGLQDKVFMDGLDVWYRPNLMGQNAFGDKVEITTLSGKLFFAVIRIRHTSDF